MWITTSGGDTYGYGSVVKIDIARGAISVGDTSAVDQPMGTPDAPCDTWMAPYGPNCGTGINYPSAIANDGTNVWVANTSGLEGIVKINIATGAVTEIDSSTFCLPSGVASTGTDVFVMNTCDGTDGGGSVSQINIATGVVTEIDSSTFNDLLAIATNGTYVWVSNMINYSPSDFSVSQIDIATGAVTEIDSSTFNSDYYLAFGAGPSG